MTRKKDKKVTVGSGQAPATIILTAPQIGGVDIASYMRAIRDADRIVIAAPFWASSYPTGCACTTFISTCSIRMRISMP